MPRYPNMKCHNPLCRFSPWRKTRPLMNLGFSPSSFPSVTLTPESWPVICLSTQWQGMFTPTAQFCKVSCDHHQLLFFKSQLNKSYASRIIWGIEPEKESSSVQGIFTFNSHGLDGNCCHFQLSHNLGGSLHGERRAFSCALEISNAGLPTSAHELFKQMRGK